MGKSSRTEAWRRISYAEKLAARNHALRKKGITDVQSIRRDLVANTLVSSGAAQSADRGQRPIPSGNTERGVHPSGEARSKDVPEVQGAVLPSGRDGGRS